MKTIGANIVLEGEASYREALKTITGQQRELTSEMELTSAQFAGQENSLEALEEKYRIVGEMIEKQKEKIEVYADAVESAKERQSNATIVYSEYAAKLALAEEELDKLKDSSDATQEAIDKQKEEVDRLKDSYAEASQALQEADRDVSYWQTSLNRAQTDLVTMEKELEKTGSYMQEARESADKTAKSINGLGEEAGESGKQVSNFGDIMKGTLASEIIMNGLKMLADLAKEAGKEIFSLATNAAYWADEVNTLSTQTGIATDTIQALKYSEELLDVSLETVTSSMAKNIRSMNSAKDGSEAYVKAYEKLGIAVTTANGDLRNSEEVFWEVIDALGKMDNATERDAVSMQLFGRNAQSLNTLIKAGSSGFQEMYQEADKLGYILDKNTLDGLNRTSDALERVSKTADAMKNQIGAEVAPAIEEAAADLQKLMEDNADEIADIIADIIPDLVDGLRFVVENLDTIIPVVEGVVTGFLTFKAATVATQALNAVMAVLPPLLESATVEQLALNAAQAISPMGAVAAAAGLLVTGLGMLCASAKEYTPKVYEISQEEQKLVDSMKAVNDAANAHRDAFSQNVETMAANRTQAQELVNKLRELEPQAKNDASAMEEMHKTVDQLNTIMPNLGLSINEVTGELNMGVDAVDAYVDSMMRQIEIEAYSERLTEILQDQVEIQTQLIEKEDAYNEAVERVNAAFEERDRAAAEYQAAYEDYMAGTAEVSDAQISALLEASQLAAQNATDVSMETREIRGEYGALQGQLEELDGEYERYQDLLADTAPQEAATEANEALTVEWRGHTIPAIEGTNEKLDELAQKYLESYEAAKNSLQNQMGLFQEFKTESQSIDSMTSSLSSQAEQMTQYGDNLQKALDLNIDPQIIASIEEMGIQGAGYLEELVKAAEAGGEEMDDFMTAWSAYQEALTDTSSKMAEFETVYGETMGNIQLTSSETTDAMMEDQSAFSTDYVESWTTMGEDTATAIEEMEPVISEDVTMVAAAAVSSLNTELGIDDTGRSSKGFRAGQQFGQSIADGVEDMEDEIVAAVAKVGRAAVAEAEEWARKIDEALGENL